MNLLEELRRQRELIRQHLDWLEQRIAALEQETGEPVEREASLKGGKEDLPASTEKDSNKLAAVTEPGELLVPQDDDDALKRQFIRHKGPLGNQIQQAKIGCLVLFTLSTLLFLFLLFGLPYLWN